MNALSLDFRRLSFETLAKIIDLANEWQVTPEEAAKRWLKNRAKVATAQPAPAPAESEVA